MENRNRSRARRALVAVALVFAVGLVGTSPGTAGAATPPITSHFNDCPAYGDVHICSGTVPSFDGSKLDVDLTLPTTGGTKHPLVLFFHGFGNNKHEWEATTDAGDGADKYRWNNHWFATHGYYVLTYTARGFRDDGTTDASQPNTPADPSGSVDVPNGTLHLKSREFEIRDSQWLAALTAAAYPNLDPSQVAVSGGSYGGGESWLQASQAKWTFPHEQDSTLPVLDLQVAVPKYPWTDLGYALAPNGHGGGPSGADRYESSQGHPDSDTGDGNPVGVAKLSFITGLSALGASKGVFEAGTTTTPSQETTEDGPQDIPAWQARTLGAGEPYDVNGAEDPTVKQIRRGLTEFRSAYYQDQQWAAQDAGGRHVAVFSIQGWTDDLFEAVESFRQFKYLKRLDPSWPVALWLGDVGHSRAQNLPDQWHRANNQAWQFVQSQINGSHDQSTTVTSEATTCANGGSNGNGGEATAQTPEGLSKGALKVNFTRGDTLTSTGRGLDPNGQATDPTFGGLITPVGQPCRTSPGPSPEYTATSTPLPSATTYIGLGDVTVPYTFTGVTGHLDARVWDVAPDGTTLLVTRGTYRIDTPAYDGSAGTLHLPLFGNHWRLAPGHRIRLDLTQNDAPYLRTSNVPSSIQFAPPTLTLPTREAGSTALAGT
ncbi:MAG: type transport system ATP-binding protein [Solirubrobacteraceae bacterium]|nr:type transport system ATP-binding protein [Solirubrobacteraceae bacterium]